MDINIVHIISSLLILFNITSTLGQLHLITEDDILPHVGNKQSWNLIFQNPFKGSVELVEAPLDKFQILVNVTDDRSERYPLTTSVKWDEDSLLIELKEKTLSAGFSDELDVDLFYMHLYLVVAASLVTICFLLSIVFLCWWNKSKRVTANFILRGSLDPDASKTPLLHANNEFHCAPSNLMLRPLTAARPLQENGIHHDRNCISQPVMLSTHSNQGHPASGLLEVNPESCCDHPDNQTLQRSAALASTLQKSSMHPGPLTSSFCQSSVARLDSGIYGGVDRQSSLSSGSATSSLATMTHTSTINRPRHIAKDFLDSNLLDKLNNGVYQTDPYNSNQHSTDPKTATNELGLDVVMQRDIYGNLLPTGQGSDETSGILSDSDASTMEKMPSSATSSIPERFISLDSNDQRYAALGMMAEVAKCPHHSYLLNQPQIMSSAVNNTSVVASATLPKGVGLNPTAAAASLPLVAEPRFNSLKGDIHKTVPPQTNVCSVHHGQQSSETMSNASSVQTVMAADEWHGNKVSNKISADRAVYNGPLVQIKTSSDGKSRLVAGPGATASLSRQLRPNKSAVVLPDHSDHETPLLPDDVVVHNPDNIECLDLNNGGGGSLSDSDPPLPPMPYSLEECSETCTLDYPPDHPSYATSPRSAFKGSRQGPPVSKQLRFTTLTLFTFCGLLAPSLALLNSDYSSVSPVVRVTIFLPPNMKRAGQNSQQFSAKYGLNSLQNITLYLNASSRTEVKLNAFDRSQIGIFDVPDASRYTNRRVCYSRYSCQHTCYPHGSYPCVCERGYRKVKNSGACEDIDECSVGDQVVQECARQGARCMNQPGNHSCRCYNNQPVHPLYGCSDCSMRCASGLYQTKRCSFGSDLSCKTCGPLCISDQFEFSSCGGSNDRVCWRTSSIPGIEIPYRQNVWFEDLMNVRDVTTRPIDKLPKNLTLMLDRGSGYKIQVKFFTELNLAPIVKPVDHSLHNDNQYFPTDLTNRTLRELCPYPLPHYYSIIMKQNKNFSSLAISDPELPGFRPSLTPCPAAGSYYTLEPSGKKHAAGSVVSCVNPAKLPALFGQDWNKQLSKTNPYLLDELRDRSQCLDYKNACHRCLTRCSNEIIKNGTNCKPKSTPDDNGRSPKLAVCYDCCVRDNCTGYCDEIVKQNCARRMCIRGPRLDFILKPEWSTEESSEFLCHMQPQQSPVYNLQWSILYKGKPLTRELYGSTLYMPKQSRDWKPVMNKVSRDVLFSSYVTGISRMPDIVGGAGVLQKGYVWNKNSDHQESILTDTRSKNLLIPRDSVSVYSETPMSVNTGLWHKSVDSNGANCSAVNALLEQLKYYTAASQIYQPINDVSVDRSGKYSFRVIHSDTKPTVEFSVPKSASVLGTVFSRVKVERGDYLKAGLAFQPGNHQDSSSLWVIQLTGLVAEFPGMFQLEVWQDDEVSTGSASTQSPFNKLVLHYDIGVFEEKRFQIRLRIPAPKQEPKKEKKFLLRMKDIDGEIDMVVTRVAQDDKRYMEQIRNYQIDNGMTEGDIFSSSGSRSTQEPVSPEDTVALPNSLFYGVVFFLVLLSGTLLVLHLTENDEISSNREHAEFKTTHYVIFLIYMLLQFLYMFAVTLTALLLSIRLLTRIPSSEISLYSDFSSNISAYEKLYLERMDGHLDRELDRQYRQVDDIKRKCDLKLDKLFDNLEKRLEMISRQSAARISTVLVSQAMLERGQTVISKLAADLAKGFDEFNETAASEMIRLTYNMKQTQEELKSSPWLKGARDIYEEVKRLRDSGALPDSTDSTKSFLDWARMSADISSSPPVLTLPSDYPVPDASQLKLEMPRVRGPGEWSSVGFGPDYQIYIPDPRELEVDKNSWTMYELPADKKKSEHSSGPTYDWVDAEKTLAQLEESEDNEKDFYITWFHLVGLAVALDALWMLHRLVLMVHTGECILYGYPRYIDCTDKGIEQKLQESSKCKRALKKTMKTFMKSDGVPRLCGSIFTLLIFYLLSTHLNEIVSQQALEYMGFYDNLMLPVNLRHQLVNSHVTQSAQRLNNQELAAYESLMNRRYHEAQYVLNKWSQWTRSFQEKQCQLFLQYKVMDKTIPAHCKIGLDDRKKEIHVERQLSFDPCEFDVVQARLFDGYSEAEYYKSVVDSSRDWLRALRSWLHECLSCFFIYVSVIMIWNVAASLVWMIGTRCHLLRERRIFESDIL